MSTFYRDYEIGRDAQGMPNKLTWLGDYEIRPKPTQAQMEAEKLAEWEKLYGENHAEKS